MTAPEPKLKVLTVVDERGKEKLYTAPGLAVGQDGTLALGTLVTDCLGQYLVDPVAAFARGDWRRVFEDTAETEPSAYYRHRLAIAEGALHRVAGADSLEAARQDAETALAAIGAEL